MSDINQMKEKSNEEKLKDFIAEGIITPKEVEFGKLADLENTQYETKKILNIGLLERTYVVLKKQGV